MTKLLADENNFIPYDKMYQNFGTTDIKAKKQAYFKSKIKEKLYLNETPIETKLYTQLKDIL